LIRADDTIKEAEEESQDMTKSICLTKYDVEQQHCFSDASENVRKPRLNNVPGTDKKIF
jgi:hypothetical protein